MYVYIKRISNICTSVSLTAGYQGSHAAGLQTGNTIHNKLYRQVRYRYQVAVTCKYLQQ